MAHLCFPWRPRIERRPSVAARLKQYRLLQRQLPFVLQPKREPRRLDISPKINRRVAAKGNLPQRFSRPMPPAAVIPRPCHNEIQVLLVRFLQPLVGRDRPVKIFLVPPARSEEHTSELQSLTNLVCRLLLEKKKTQRNDSCIQLLDKV